MEICFFPYSSGLSWFEIRKDTKELVAPDSSLEILFDFSDVMPELHLKGPSPIELSHYFSHFYNISYYMSRLSCKKNQSVQREQKQAQYPSFSISV